jgi:hypothetical protein
MKAFGPRLLSAILVAFLVATVASAGTLHGTVVNRTTGKPTPNIDLTFLNPVAGMVEVGAAKSDAQGQFTVTNDAIGAGPILIRATYHDVSFNTFAPPGRPQVDVEIYELSKDPKTISIASHVIIYQPRGDKLVGAEEYMIDNVSQPASAFFRSEGNFDFVIPAQGTLGQVATTTSMGMSVTQASIDKGKGRFAISYPFRPGQTSVRLSYEMPYVDNAAALNFSSSYPGVKLILVVPPGVSLSGDGLQPIGEQQGMMVYSHPPLAPKALLTLNVSGVPAPQSADASSGQAQGTPEPGNSRQGGPQVDAAPSRLNDFKWYLFGGLGAMFAMGAILLTRKQVVLPPAADDDDADVSAPPARPSNVSPAALANAAAAVSAQVTASLDSLKDSIFRLELRRQAGTISEEDYAREKLKLDKLLRDLVKG